MEKKKYKFLILFLLSIFCLLRGHTYAQQTAIDSGLSYLHSTQNPDGSWGGTETSLNTILQTTATTVRTLQLLGFSVRNAEAFLSAQTPDTVDDLAHQLEVLAASGADVSSLVASIKAAQQDDGGWGIDLEKTFPSGELDTLSALRALRTALEADTNTATKSVGFLLGIQNSDGGWGATQGQPSEVFYTALTLLVLNDFQATFGLSTFIAAGTDFLMNQQNTDGSFGSPMGTTFETALALQALLRFVVDPVKASSAVQHLVSTQGGNGSWEDDPYSTALALRALSDSQFVDRNIDNDKDGFTEKQGDCNDANPAIHPGASDLTVNGIDENCDGIDGLPVGNVDADGDGFTPDQKDCDDTNANIHPGAIDIPNNGIDEDCNGQDAIFTVEITSVNLFKAVGGEKTATTTFKAYETVAIEVSVNDPNVILTLFVTSPTGQVFDVQSGSGVGEFQFNTINHIPGTYNTTVQALAINTGLLLDEEKVTFTIKETLSITNVALGLIPRFTHVGATETVTIALSLTNRSNIAANLTLQHELKSPSGTIINSGTAPLTLPPDRLSESVTLASFGHTFIESGDHPVFAEVFNGVELLATLSGVIAVAPNIRIDPTKTLTPQIIPPNGDKRIRIDIHLQGNNR